MGESEVTLPKTVINLPGPLKSFTLEDKHIGPAVSKIDFNQIYRDETMGN